MIQIIINNSIVGSLCEVAFSDSDLHCANFDHVSGEQCHLIYLTIFRYKTMESVKCRWRGIKRRRKGVKGQWEMLNGDKEALKSDRVVSYGNGEALKSSLGCTKG